MLKTSSALRHKQRFDHAPATLDGIVRRSSDFNERVLKTIVAEATSSGLSSGLRAARLGTQEGNLI
jgi:hypothetical protein